MFFDDDSTTLGIMQLVANYLGENELFALRGVCKETKIIATRELRRRNKRLPIRMRCCTTIEEIFALKTIYGGNNCFRRVQYNIIFHASCDYGRAPLFPSDDKLARKLFTETETLIVSERTSEGATSSFLIPPRPNFLSLGNTFRNITRLTLRSVTITMAVFCDALRDNWTRLKWVTIELCEGFTPHWLLELNENAESITIKENRPAAKRAANGDIIYITSPSLAVEVSPKAVNENAPRIKYLAVDSSVYDAFNVFEMLSSAPELREAVIRVRSAMSRSDAYLIAPLLEKLRINFLCDGREFYLRDVRCKSLKALEVKLKFSIPPPFDVLSKLAEQLSAVEHFTLTSKEGGHLSDEANVAFSSVFDALAFFRQLRIFIFRKDIRCLEHDWSRTHTSPILRYLRYKCTATRVQFYLRDIRNYNEQQTSEKKYLNMLNFMYDLNDVALSRDASVTYTVYYTRNIGRLVLHKNVKFVFTSEKFKSTLRRNNKCGETL